MPWMGYSKELEQMKIFGVSIATIALVVIVAVIAKKYGSSIPLLKSL